MMERAREAAATVIDRHIERHASDDVEIERRTVEGQTTRATLDAAAEEEAS